MNVSQRRYKMFADYNRVDEFLKENYSKDQNKGQILQPRWEYAHVHPYFNYKLTHRFGIWERDNEIVGIACYEMDLGECLISTKIGLEQLKREMVLYAEKELSKVENGKKKIELTNIGDDPELKNFLLNRDYKKGYEDRNTIYDYSNGFDSKPLPEGFTMISLDDENDIRKIHEVIWKGFDHGNNPDDNFEDKLHMQSAPNFRKDLTIIVKAPNGDYACFCGMWIDEVNHYAYLEPLCTDPKYRGKGLATAALFESMKRTQKYGATYCFGGSSDYYTKIGFSVLDIAECWYREW